MEKTKTKKEYQDFHIEIENSDAQRLQGYCSETDYKYTAVFRRSIRQYLDLEEQKRLSETKPSVRQNENLM